MGRYFGREPRYTRAELERQAQEAIDARIGMGRPPAEDFLPLERRLAEADLAQAAPPPVEAVPGSQPFRIHQIRPPAAAPARTPAPAKARAKPAPEPAAAAGRRTAD